MEKHTRAARAQPSPPQAEAAATKRSTTQRSPTGPRKRHKSSDGSKTCVLERANQIHYTWKRNFDLLSTFQREYGHCRIPLKLVVGSVRLGVWVEKQRHNYKNYEAGTKGTTSTVFSEECSSLLNAIGFEWEQKDPNVNSDSWQDKFERLCSFQREHGHCRVARIM